MRLTYDKGSTQPTCSGQQDTDEVGGQRVRKYPNGIQNVSQQQCCSTCHSDTQCTVWVYEPSSKNCWLLYGVTRSKPRKDRVLGTMAAFSENNLHIDLNFAHASVKTWNPSTENKGNLNGTRTSLDNVAHWVELDPGLISKDGWWLVDDTTAPRLVANSAVKIPWLSKDFTDTVDWYFLGYGRDFRGILGEFSQLVDHQPIPPLSSFGVWWSLYWKFSAQSFNETVLQGYRDHGLPLNHVVLDMDWHIEPKVKGCQSWGGFTWNKQLFPDPQAFKNALHTPYNGYGWPLKLLLNVHPQTGVDHCQAHYQDMCKTLHMDCSKNQTIPCNMTNPHFYNALFDIYLNPNQGVDYWWTDYGGCGDGGGYNLLWSNYGYQHRHAQDGQNKRGLVLSRWGGIGNSRNPIGFSGDAHALWTMLAFEIYFTPTAANVLFGHWSHDIGGFHTEMWPNKKVPSELYLRWIQFGALSPVFRTHCNHCERRIWMFEDYLKMKDAMIFRNNLAPYIYSEVRRAWENGIPFLHPMYYDSPMDESSYNLKKQYMFGDSILAAPISTPVDNRTGLITETVWLGSGSDWFTWKAYNSTDLHKGGTSVTTTYSKEHIPLFVKAGSIIPLKTMDSIVSVFPDPLMWVTWVGPGVNKGTGYIFEDDGETLDYEKNATAKTPVNWAAHGDYLSFTVHYTEGTYVGQGTERAHILQIRGGIQPTKVVVAGKEVPYQPHPPANSEGGWWGYAEDESLSIQGGSLLVHTGTRSIRSDTLVRITIPIS